MRKRLEATGLLVVSDRDRNPASGGSFHLPVRYGWPPLGVSHRFPSRDCPSAVSIDARHRADGGDVMSTNKRGGEDPEQIKVEVVAA